MKYFYPAIFHKDDSGRFAVLFPDFDVATSFLLTCLIREPCY